MLRRAAAKLTICKLSGQELERPPLCGNEAQKASCERQRLSPRKASYIGTGGGVVAEWLRTGLQNRVRRFNSGRRLQPALRPQRYALLKLARFVIGPQASCSAIPR